MMRKAIFFILLISSAAMYSCKVDQICASYQSYFLISPSPQPSTFSAQLGDSIPYHDVPELFALVSEDGYPRKDLPNTEKNKNGLVKSEWALVKNWNKRIVPMEVVIPEVVEDEDEVVIYAGNQYLCINHYQDGQVTHGDGIDLSLEEGEIETFNTIPTDQ